MEPGQARIRRYCGMKGMKKEEKEGTAIRRYIRSTSDILPKGKHIVYSNLKSTQMIGLICLKTKLYSAHFVDMKLIQTLGGQLNKLIMQTNRLESKLKEL
jgi:hypothetical protein